MKYHEVYALLRERMADENDIPDTDDIIRAALDAARDAVAALRAPGYEPWGEFIYREVLPAIDALRGEA